MAPHDHPVHRFTACGIVGPSVAVDGRSAVRPAWMRAFREATGLAVDCRSEGSFPVSGHGEPGHGSQQQA